MDGDITRLVDEIRRNTGDHTPRAAARLMSLLENHPARIAELYAGAADWPQPSMVVGITGPPGAGKSTLVDQLVGACRKRHPQRRLGVIAVDPSSPFTRGSVMGDRVRMMRHATDPRVFVRSLASRGHLGGLALGVKGVLHVMGLMRCELVLIETVGVGQSEMEVAAFADLVAVVLAPGQGDGIQLLKAGLMEAGDLFVVNKSDRDGAAQLHAQLLTSLTLKHSIGTHADPVPVCMISARGGQGIAELLDLLEKRHVDHADALAARRRRRFEQEVREAVLQEAQRRLAQTLDVTGVDRDDIRRVLLGQASVSELADALLRDTLREISQPKEGHADEERPDHRTGRVGGDAAMGEHHPRKDPKTLS
jgi:LAO/AO transport system kinase